MDSPETWEAARAYAALFGSIPASFATTLRTLVSDQEKNNGALSSASRFNALRLLKGRNLKAPYYFASLTFKPELYAGQEFVSDDDLLKAFKPIEVAAIFGIIYYYKKARKLADPDEWEFIAPFLTRGYELGGYVGNSIPKVGMAAALFSWTARYIALTCFLRHNKKHFQEYRRGLKNKDSLLSLNDELVCWGCTDLQIASILLQSLGFGVDYSSSFVVGLSQEGPLDKTTIRTSPFKVADIWIQSLAADGQIPNIVHDASYHPSAEQTAQLKEQAMRFLEKGSRHDWIEKKTEDISPELTPQLFQGGAKTESPADEEPPPDDGSDEADMEDNEAEMENLNEELS